MTSKLTLNLGVRWQTESPYRTKYGQQSQFDPTAIDPLTGRRGASAASDGPLAKPRLPITSSLASGMAYNFRQNWVFRGGFALNTLDLWTNGLRENFDEYLATAIIQPPAGNPDIAFKLSQGPPPINFNVRPDGSVPFIGTNFTRAHGVVLRPRHALSLHHELERRHPAAVWKRLICWRSTTRARRALVC